MFVVQKQNFYNGSVIIKLKVLEEGIFGDKLPIFYS